MIPRAFTVSSWAHEARMPLARATLFTEDLVAMGLAEPIDQHRFRLTARGLSVVRALCELPTLEEAA